MEKDKLEYRMMVLVPYNISPIQQGIQFGHAVVEYMLNFPTDLNIYIYIVLLKNGQRRIRLLSNSRIR